MSPSLELLGVERSIQVYRNDNYAFVKEINVDHIALSSILTIITPKQDDELLYDLYELDDVKLNWFKQFVMIEEDFKLYHYVLVCLGIYKKPGDTVNENKLNDG